MVRRFRPAFTVLLGSALALLVGTAAAQSTLGEVRKVDKAQAKLTLQHEAITSLNMPAMTSPNTRMLPLPPPLSGRTGTLTRSS